jgi:hypothetical protein
VNKILRGTNGAEQVSAKRKFAETLMTTKTMTCRVLVATFAGCVRADPGKDPDAAPKSAVRRAFRKSNAESKAAKSTAVNSKPVPSSAALFKQYTRR